MNMCSQTLLADTEIEVLPDLCEGLAQDSTPRTSLRTLPSRLRDRYEIHQELSAQGSEADVFQVRALDGSGLRVVKLYRTGRTPKTNVLQAVSQSHSNHLVKIFEFAESG